MAAWRIQSWIEPMPENPRHAVLDALLHQPDAAWLMAIAAMRGPEDVLANVVMDDPTPVALLVVAIDAEIERLEAPPAT